MYLYCMAVILFDRVSIPHYPIMKFIHIIHILIRIS